MLHLITTRKVNIISTVLVCGLFLMGAAFQYGGIKHDLVSTATSASSLVLTNTSTQVQRLTGSTAQTVKLPNATTSRVGWWYIVSNDSTATATVTNGNDEAIGTIAAGNSATFYLTSVSTLGGPWDLQPGNGSSGSSGTGGYIGALITAGTTNCQWSISANNTFTDFAADADCPAPTVVGTGVSAPATKIPGVTISSAAAATYKITASGALRGGTASVPCSWRFTDGTDNGTASVTGFTANNVHSSIISYITFSSSGTKNLKLQSTGYGGSGSCLVEPLDAFSDYVVSVERVN